jgi:non-specific serine/threonine protein kinase
MLAECSGLTILVTSRTVLHISGEHTIILSPLPVLAIDSSDDSQSDAVRLFVRRAKEARATFDFTGDNLRDIAAICARLDGLPLAIELAAARAAHLSPTALLPRLERRLAPLTEPDHDTPRRRRTMRDAIAWSYDLLTEHEQQVFCRLSVFVGGCSVDAVRAVGFDANDSPADDWAAIDVVGSLVDQSLLDQVEGPESESRFIMLETIREYGLDLLAASGELDATHRRHADWCLAFAREIGDTFVHRRDSGWRDQLEADLGNIRAALTWLSDQGDIVALLRLTSALHPLWNYLGHSREGVQWLLHGLGRAGGVPNAVTVRATILAAELISEQCNHTLANELASDAARIARESDDKASLARALYLMGRNAQISGDVAAGRARIDEALALFEQIGAVEDAAHTRTYLAMLGTGEGAHELQDRDQLANARQCWETELELYRASNHIPFVARATHGLAYVAYLAGEYDRALELSQDALRMRWDTGDMSVFPAEFEDIGDIANALGQHERAARLYGAASALRQRIDTPIPWWFEAEYEREVDRTRQTLSPRTFDAAWLAGRALPLEDAVDEALSVRVDGGREALDPAAASRFDLTNREMEVLRLLVDGASNPEIAAALYISRKTAANHVANILAKMGAESRTAAASIALRSQVF